MQLKFLASDRRLQIGFEPQHVDALLFGFETEYRPPLLVFQRRIGGQTCFAQEFLWVLVTVGRRGETDACGREQHPRANIETLLEYA